MNSLNQCDTLQFGTRGVKPLQACSSSFPAGSRPIPDVVSKDVNVLYVTKRPELTSMQEIVLNCIKPSGKSIHHLL